MKRGFLILIAIALAFFGGIFYINRRAVTDESDSVRMKIALIMDGTRDDRSLCQSQYEAMEAYRSEHAADVVYYDNVPADESFPALLESLISEGRNILFFSSYVYDDYIMEVAPNHPEVFFLSANGLQTGNNVSSFNGRMYQMRYLMGLIAGFQSETGRIGYVAAEPVAEMIRQVNAFAIGVHATNPTAKVYVRFTGDWNDDEAARAVTTSLLDDHEIDVLTLHLNTIAPLETADARGVYVIGNNYDNAKLFPGTYLTASIFDWEPFFEARISECERHKFVGRHYWEGVKNGLVTLAPLTGNVRFNARERVDIEMKRIVEGRYDVFFGPVRDITGRVRVRADETLSDEYLLYEMNWFAEGIVIE